MNIIKQTNRTILFDAINLFQFWEDAKRKSARFMGKVSIFAVEKIVLELAMDYHEAIAVFLNTCLHADSLWPDCRVKPEIYMGEYMGRLIRLGNEG